MKTCLIDDDNLAICLTEHLLRTEGFSEAIYTFQSAGEALEDIVKEK